MDNPSPIDPKGGIRFNPFEPPHTFDATRCLISGQPLQSDEELRPVFTVEWMDNLNLWEQKLTLPHGGTLAYPDLKLPVRHECWKGGLDAVARKCPNLILAGAHTDGWTNTEQIYQWLCWLFLGTLYAEMKAVQTHALQHQAWTAPAFLQRYRMIHLSLQGACYPLQYLGYDPGSVFILKIQDSATLQPLLVPSKSPSDSFDFKCSSNTQTLAVRVHGTGLMASLGDNGAHLAFFEDEFKPLRSLELMPIQWDELFARMCYRNHLLRPVFEYGISYADAQDPTTYLQMRIPPEFAHQDAFEPWSDRDYASVLQQYLPGYGADPRDATNSDRTPDATATA